MSETKAPDPTGRPKDRRKLVAVVYADMVGYSRLIGMDDIGTLNRLRSLRSNVIDPAIDEHRGRVVQTGGDSLLIVFDSIDGAVCCAMNVQQQVPILDGDHPSDRAIRFRIGINIGDAIADGTDLHGDAVNVAARLQTECPPGGICVSRSVRDHVHGRLGLEFVALGARDLKNITRPVEAFVLKLDGVVTTSKSVEQSPVRSTREALTLPDKPSIAALAFTNMSADPEQEYFADGMVEEIITALSRITWLFVIARNSSFTYKGQSPDVKQVGRELGVRYVLEGSVRKGGNRVRITAQLIDALSGAHLWADRFDGLIEDVFELQDKVASGVVGAIEPKLLLAETERARRKPTENLDAHDNYLRALAQVHKLTREANSEAIRLSLRALEIDPSFAPASALAAWCWTIQKWQGWIMPGSQYATGIELAKQAVENGTDDPDVLWMAAHTLAYLGNDHATARTLLGRALAINPNSAHAWGTKGLVNSFHGESDCAIESFQRAVRLSPLDPLNYHYRFGIGLAHLAATRYQDAWDWVDQSVREQPRFAAGFRVKLALCGLLGRVEEGCACLSRLLELQPGLTVAAFAAHAATFLSGDVVEIMITGLRKAGLPESGVLITES